MVRAASIRIGVSGWRYAPWRGVFYPSQLPQRRELEYVASQFPTVELNGSFYSLQTPAFYRQCHAATPPRFVFAIKGPRYLTHLLKLQNAGTALPNFFASGLFELREKLGPFLWQFPARRHYDPEQFENFFALLPRDTAAAAALARRHDARARGRVQPEPHDRRTLRHAVEVRHDSFMDAAFVRQLRRHRIELVFADTAGLYPYFEDLTADFCYLRLHGQTELYASGYTDESLQRWSQRIAAWSRGRAPADARTVAPAGHAAAARDVYCYFDNDQKVMAPRDAASLLRLLGQPAPS